MSRKKTRKQQADRQRFLQAKSFEEKTAAVFQILGFEVEMNRVIGGNEIDIYIKKKMSFGDRYEHYICECKDYKDLVGIEWINKYVGVSTTVNTIFQHQLHLGPCTPMMIARKGFSEPARENAKANGMILTTYDQLLADLMNFNRYLTTFIQNFESDPIHELYIQQDVVPERTMESLNSFDFIDQWLKKPDRKQFSLLGDYGTGKTSFAKMLTYRMAKAYKNEPFNNRIPFFVDLRQCQKALSLDTLILEQLKSAAVEPVNADIFLKLLAEGKILLIFDAFDEMATMSNAEITLANFRQLNQAVTGEAKVIITSRTHYFLDKDEVERILKKEGKGDLRNMPLSCTVKSQGNRSMRSSI